MQSGSKPIVYLHYLQKIVKKKIKKVRIHIWSGGMDVGGDPKKQHKTNSLITN